MVAVTVVVTVVFTVAPIVGAQIDSVDPSPPPSSIPVSPPGTISVPPGTSPDTTPPDTTPPVTTPPLVTLPPPTDVLPEQFPDAAGRDTYEAIDGGGDARSGYYAAQPEFDPAVYNNQLPEQVVAGQTSLATATSAEALARTGAATARAALDDVEREVAASEGDYRDAVDRAATARVAFETSVVSAYLGGNTPRFDALLSSGNADDYVRRSGLLSAVTASHEKSVRELDEVRRSLDGDVVAMGDRLAAARSRHAAAVEDLASAGAARSVAQDAVEVWVAGSHAMIAGFTFPVAGPHDALWDSFGAARNGGTSYSHWHEGTDILAPRGTPLVAAEDGVIATTRTNFLGGNALRINGASGVQYYYAHLVAIAPGIVEGLTVHGGQVVGWVGNTGDAAGGPTHLHFEIHVGEHELINPFPLLVVADRRRPLVSDPTPRAWGLARPDGAERTPLDPALRVAPPG